jgi:hypothetical protein
MTSLGSRRRWMPLAMVGLVAIGALCAPVAVLFGPARAREFLYREVAYRAIITRVTAGLTDDAAITRALFEYVADQQDAPRTYPAIDRTVWDGLVAGTAWCDQQAWSLGTLLARKGVPGTLLMLRGRHVDSHHTVATVFLDGSWRVLDPFWGLTFIQPTGAPATFHDLQHEARRAELSSGRAEAIARFDPEFFAGYFALFEKDHPPTQWMALTEVHPQRRWLHRVLDAYVSLLGQTGVARFQDVYLWRRFRAGGEDVFWRARHYDLFARDALASEAYRTVVADAATAYREDALYFLGRVQQRLGDWDGSAQTFTQLLDEFGTAVNPKWKLFAHYRRGLALERAGEAGLAAEDYAHAVHEQQLEADVRLLALRGRRTSPTTHAANGM